MTLLDSIKPFWPLILTFFLPRALSTFNTLKLSYRTRPPPRPLTQPTTRSLNILFASILVFLILSLQRSTSHSTHNLNNVFTQTNSLITTPTETVFTRLALLRPSQRLTQSDVHLKQLLTTPTMRATYLTVGPDPLLTCPFCAPTPKLAYTYHLFALPAQTLLPHLLHIIFLGLATSSPLTGPLPARHRSKFLLAALPLLLIDIYLVLKPLPFDRLTPQSSPQTPTSTPWSTYSLLRTLRPLTICALDTLLAFFLWVTATNRFIYFPFLANPESHSTRDPSDLQHELAQTIQTIGAESSSTLAKMRGYAVARNAVVRDKTLRLVEERYWEGVTATAAISDGVGSEEDEIWLDEEVQAAVARVLAAGDVDVARQRKEIGAWVDGVTNGLERSETRQA